MTTGRPLRHKRDLLVSGVVLLLVCAFTLGCQSIHTAARKGDIGAVSRRLKRGCDPDKMHWWLLTSPLMEAARGGHLHVAKRLLEKGADVNRGYDTYRKALHYAILSDDRALVRFFLARGANTRNGLHDAAMGGHIESARLLLDCKADINQKGIDEATPLELAVSYWQIEMVGFLLTHGADVNSQGLYGTTALHVATGNDDLAVGKLLLEHGADPTLESNGRRPRPRSEEFRALLKQYEAAR